jgi:acyl-homoserine lactone synthase
VVYVIDKNNRHLFEAELEQMFRLRHKIYVEKRGWEAIRREDGREIDQFDTEDTIYFVRLDPDGKVVGSIRLKPTTTPYLLADIFSDIITNGEAPRSPDKYEMTRVFALDEPKEGLTANTVCCELLIAICQWCTEKGIVSMPAVIDTFFLGMCIDSKFDVQLLGLPTPYKEGECIAVDLVIQDATVPALAKHAKLPKDKIYWTYRAEDGEEAVA